MQKRWSFDMSMLWAALIIITACCLYVFGCGIYARLVPYKSAEIDPSVPIPNSALVLMSFPEAKTAIKTDFTGHPAEWQKEYERRAGTEKIVVVLKHGEQYVLPSMDYWIVNSGRMDYMRVSIPDLFPSSMIYRPGRIEIVGKKIRIVAAPALDLFLTCAFGLMGICTAFVLFKVSPFYKKSTIMPSESV